MKTYLAIFILALAISRFENAYGQCPPPVDTLISKEIDNTCLAALPIFTTRQLRNLPSAGSTQFTFWTALLVNDFCSTTAAASIFNFMIGTGADSTTAKSVIEFRIPESRNQFQIYTTDSTGTAAKVMEFSINDGEWVRVGVSVDLGNDLFNVFYSSPSGFSSSTLPSTPKIDYGSWKLASDNVFIYFGSNPTSTYGVTFANSGILYDKYFSQDNLPISVMQPPNSALIARYEMDQTTEGFIEDTSGYYESIGRLYFGASTDVKTDSTERNSPDPSATGIDFTSLTQYLTIPSPAPFATTSSTDFLTYSFTLSFWLKVSQQSSTSQTILSRTNKDNQEIYSVILTQDLKIAAKISGVQIKASTDSFTFNEWKLVTVTIGAGGITLDTGLIAIYFDDKLETSVGYSPLTPPAIFPEATTDTFLIQGFRGTIKHFQIVSPGGGIVNNPSCKTDCRYSLGYTYSQCLVPVPTCTSGTYYDEDTGDCLNCDSSCKTCSGPSSTECTSCTAPKVLDSATNKCYVPVTKVVEEIKGLSAWAIVGIALGSVFVSWMLAGIIIAICRKCTTKEDDENPVLGGQELLLMDKNRRK